MSVQTEINRITTKRNQSFTAVASKGVTVPQGSTLDDLPGLITQIEQGGGGEVYAAISVTYPAGSVCTATNGTITLTAADTSGQVVFGIPEPSSTPETWTVSCTDGTDTDSTTVDIEEYGQTEYVDLIIDHVFGVEWDGTSTTLWARTDDAANFSDPIPYVLGATNYRSIFDIYSPWKDMTIVEDAEAGTMVKIPKFWYKITQNGEGIKIQISDIARSGYSVCPACMDRGDGNGERDYILVGRYHCSSTNYKSVSGQTPKTSVTRATFRTYIHNLGNKVYQWDWSTLFTIWLLYLVEYANWNSQDAIGYGCGNNSSVQNVGASDSMPYHTGTMHSTRTTYGVGVQYRNIEGLWDNCREWVDGCVNHSQGLYIQLIPSSFSDTILGVNVGLPVNGFPKELSVMNVTGAYPLFIPSSSGGSNSTYTCDAWGYNGSNPCIYTGGDYSQSLNSGLFYFRYGTSSATSSSVGSRLMKLP